MKVLLRLGIVLGALLVLLAGVLVFKDPPVYPRGVRTNDPYLTDDAAVLSDGVRLPLRSWGVATASGAAAPPRAIVIGLHGAGNYSANFDLPAVALAQAGIATYAYDQRGHGNAPDRGKWAGVDSLVTDMNEVVGLIRARHPGVPVFLAGYSMGGCVLLNAAAEGRYPVVNGTILMSPGVNIGHHLAWPSRAALNIVARLAPGSIVPRPKEIDTGLTDNQAMGETLRHDPLNFSQMNFGYAYGVTMATDTAMPGAERLATPTLVLYGAHDVSVSPEEHAEVGRRVTAPKRDIRYADGYHQLMYDLRREVVFRDIAQWIGENLSGSGVAK